jgi:hypothetical protein
MLTGVLRAQIIYNNIPDTVTEILSENIKVQSYGIIKIEEDHVLLNIIPIDQNIKLEKYLITNCGRFILLNDGRKIPILFHEDFQLYKINTTIQTPIKIDTENINNVENKPSVNDRNDYFLVKFNLNGKFIRIYGNQ